MKLLLINPNTTDSVSELIRAEALRSASPGTDITVMTAPFGVAYIETRFEALIGAYATAQLAAEHCADFDAIVVAAFGDPEHFKHEVDRLVRDIRSSERLPGVERIWLPGEQSHEKRQRYSTQGIPVAPTLISELNALAIAWGIAPLTAA